MLKIKTTLRSGLPQSVSDIGGYFLEVLASRLQEPLSRVLAEGLPQARITTKVEPTRVGVRLVVSLDNTQAPGLPTSGIRIVPFAQAKSVPIPGLESRIQQIVRNIAEQFLADPTASALQERAR